MGEMTFRKTQYALESASAHGTPVAATKQWPGTITVPADRKPVYPDDHPGSRARARRSEIYQVMADKISLKMADGAFQILPFLFSLGLKGGITPAEQTAGKGDYFWDFTPSMAFGVSNAPDSATIRYGDDTQAYLIEYLMSRGYTIGGKVGDDSSISVEADCFGRQITKGAFTNEITPQILTGMSANMTKIFIDSSWATLGNTQKTNLLREWEVQLLTGVHEKFSGNGQKYFASHGESYIDAMATLTFEGNDAADDIYDDFLSQTPRAIRFQVDGPAVAAGAKNHSLIMDIYGTFEEVIPLGGDQDGDNLHTAVFHAISDGQATEHAVAVKVTTNIAEI